MSAVWWPKLRDSVTTRTRGSPAASSSRIFARAVARPVVDEDELEREALERREHALAERRAVSSSLNIGATTLSSVSSRDMLSIWTA